MRRERGVISPDKCLRGSSDTSELFCEELIIGGKRWELKIETDTVGNGNYNEKVTQLDMSICTATIWRYNSLFLKYFEIPVSYQVEE